MAYSITHMALLQALTSILLFASSSILLVVQAGSAAESTTSSAGTYRFELTHVDANRGFTREELIQRSEARAKLRAAMLSSDDSGLNTHAKYIASARYAPQEYLMELQMGKPLLTFKAVADTGSDLVWTRKLDNCRCQASSTFNHWSCSHPNASAPGNKPDLVPCNKESRSSTTPSNAQQPCKATSSNGPCMFKRMYGDSKTASGFMATERLTLSPPPPSNSDEKHKPISLGCAIDWGDGMIPEAADGIVGLNRGELSLVKKLKLKNFAYCLRDPVVAASEDAPSSRLLFDYKENLLDSSVPFQATSLVDAVDEENNPVGSLMYHVQLDGISVGKNSRMNYKSLPHDSFKRKSSRDRNKGVMFVDSGTSQTFLEKDVFDRLIELLKDEHGLEAVTYEKKNCFRLKQDAGSEWPEMALYFPGAEMHLPRANYMSETKAAGPEVFCLTIHEDAKQSILGNFQQQNMHMLFDLDHPKGEEKLKFALHKDCSKM